MADAFGINWGALEAPDYGRNALAYYQQGRKMSREWDVEEAYSGYQDDPQEAYRRLMRLGEPERANQVLVASENAAKVRDKSDPEFLELMKDGKLSKAAKWMASRNPALARDVYALSKDQLEAQDRLASEGVDVLMGARQLAPEQRAAWAQQNKERLLDAGLSEQQFDGFNWADDTLLRATATEWAGWKAMVSEFKTTKFGDQVVMTEESPFGGRIAETRALPETREERLARERFQAENEDRDRRFGLDAQKFAHEQGQDSAKPVTPAQVAGRVADRIARREPVSPEELKIYNDYITRGDNDDDGFGGAGNYDYGDGVKPPARPAAGAPPTARTSQARPAQPKPGPAAPPASALKEGVVTTFGNGQRWTLRGGKPQRVG